MEDALKAKTHYTLSEYIEYEEHSPIRSEYYQGELFAMAGTSDVHNRIAQNLTFALRTATKGGLCEAYIENVKAELVPDEFYCYPDVMLTCDPRDKQDRYIKRYPRIIAEVLSPGTESYDRNKKQPHYLRLPTLQALLLISQSAIQVELFLRKGGDWVYSFYTSRADVLQIDGIEMTVADLYEGANLVELIEREA
ncbi:MAG: Uma2 family endonuclease [Bacteroidetes bacterium]|nr:MAG: Uma2 family endonuclease [Bacteroidota bacterium]